MYLFVILYPVSKRFPVRSYRRWLPNVAAPVRDGLLSNSVVNISEWRSRQRSIVSSRLPASTKPSKRPAVVPAVITRRKFSLDVHFTAAVHASQVCHKGLGGGGGVKSLWKSESLWSRGQRNDHCFRMRRMQWFCFEWEKEKTRKESGERNAFLTHCNVNKQSYGASE